MTKCSWKNFCRQITVRAEQVKQPKGLKAFSSRLVKCKLRLEIEKRFSVTSILNFFKITFDHCQPQQRNPAFLLPDQIPRSNVGQVAHLSPTPWVTLQEADITRRALEAACWLWLGCWSNNVANNHFSPGPFNCNVLRSCRLPQWTHPLLSGAAVNTPAPVWCRGEHTRSCLVPRWTHPPHWRHHQRRIANCYWMSASYSLGQPCHPHMHLTCWASSQWSPLSLAHRAMDLGHLLHSTLTRPSSADARRLKSRHPFVPAAQQLISSPDNNNIRAAQWADYQWNAGWLDNTTRLRIFFPDTGTHPPEWPSQEQPGSRLTQHQKRGCNDTYMLERLKVVGSSRTES